MADTIFTKIIKGDIPSYKVYEDSKTYAFLDIHPVQPGHTLVVPKSQIEFIWDLEQADYEAVMNTSKKVALRLKEVLKVPYVGVQVIGVDVPHAHVHLIPFSVVAQYRHQPNTTIPIDDEILARLARQLYFE